MVQNRQVTLLGDSILKGIQVDLGDRRYRTHNEINMEALESEFQLSIHNDAHFGATVSGPSLPTCRRWTASAFSTGGAEIWTKRL